MSTHTGTSTSRAVTREHRILMVYIFFFCRFLFDFFHIIFSIHFNGSPDALRLYSVLVYFERESFFFLTFIQHYYMSRKKLLGKNVFCSKSRLSRHRMDRSENSLFCPVYRIRNDIFSQIIYCTWTIMILWISIGIAYDVDCINLLSEPIHCIRHMSL